METKKEMRIELSFLERLLQAQMEIGAIKKDSDNPYFKSKYFDINALLAEVKPVLNKHGILLLQPVVVKDGQTGIETAIKDSKTNEGIWSFFPLPVLPDPQKTGSAITYYRRYALQSLLGLEAEDDDGAVASGTVVKKNIKNKEDEPF